MRSLFSVIGTLMITTLVALLVLTPPAHAEDTVPLSLVYNGHLLDSSGNPITTSHNIRFSFWDSADFVASDITATGAINTAATTYADWQEVHTIIPNTDGFFTVELGTINALPSIPNIPTATLLSLYLQVEVKAAADANTAYELLDSDITDATNDRSSVLSVPFALNANYLDKREIGTGSGDIALIGSGGVFPTALIPGSTNDDTYIIDFNDTATGFITLQFGNTLNETLAYDIINDLFTFSNSVSIQGDLTVTGLINGIDISTIATAGDSQLRVSSGGGLLANVTAGSYRLNGTVVDFAGVSSVNLTDAATNYLYFSGSGFTKSTTGFPTTESYIPIAEVITAGGIIATITDRRALQADDREQDVKHTYEPLYDDTTYDGDGSDNTGRLFVDFDIPNQRNYYSWASSRSVQNDFDIVLRPRLPDYFQSWNTGSMEVDYRSTNASSTVTKLDIEVYDTAGALVTLVGSTGSLASTTWATTTLNFAGTPTWTPGEHLTVKYRVFAENDEQMQIGNSRFSFHTFAP